MHWLSRLDKRGASFLLLFLILSPLSLFAQKGEQNKILFERGAFRIFEKKAVYEDSIVHRSMDTVFGADDPDRYREMRSHHYQPLSLIGDHYSYYGEHAYQGAGGTPGSSVEVRTIELGGKDTVPITELFKENSVLKALKKDQWVQRKAAERSIGLKGISSFQVMLDSLNRLSNAQFKEDGFAVLEQHEERGLFSVRLIGEKPIGWGHRDEFQLGLKVKAKERTLELIDEQAHFFMDRFAAGLVR